MSVDRCICKNVTFKRLLEVATHLGVDFASLQAATGCGTGCGLCVPYARIALKTGKTRLPVMTDAQCNAILHEELHSSIQQNAQ
jgi:bacterioferritin-associated ferredoxin